jgi:hypothetical protein
VNFYRSLLVIIVITIVVVVVLTRHIIGVRRLREVHTFLYRVKEAALTRRQL